MIKIRCVIDHITYQNQENGYSVMKVKVKDYKDPVTLVGNLLDVPVGAVLLCEGDWKMDKRYGNQFVAETWEEVMPATVYGIEKYLGSGLVKGIGPIRIPFSGRSSGVIGTKIASAARKAFVVTMPNDGGQSMSI